MISVLSMSKSAAIRLAIRVVECASSCGVDVDKPDHSPTMSQGAAPV
jgi:hypothetical protein